MVSRISSINKALARILFWIRALLVVRVWISSPVSRTMALPLISLMNLTFMKARLFTDMSVDLILNGKKTWLLSMAYGIFLWIW